MGRKSTAVRRSIQKAKVTSKDTNELLYDYLQNYLGDKLFNVSRIHPRITYSGDELSPSGDEMHRFDVSISVNKEQFLDTLWILKSEYPAMTERSISILADSISEKIYLKIKHR